MLVAKARMSLQGRRLKVASRSPTGLHDFCVFVVYWLKGDGISQYFQPFQTTPH